MDASLEYNDFEPKIGGLQMIIERDKTQKNKSSG